MIPVKITSTQSFSTNVWVALELSGVDFALLHLSGANTSDNYYKVYFVDSDQTTSLSFFRMCWDAKNKYALFILQLPSLNTERTIYIKTDATSDKAFISSIRYASFYIDFQKDTKDLSGNERNLAFKKVWYATLPQNIYYNDTFIAHAQLVSTGAAQYLVSADGFLHGIALDANRKLGIRWNSTWTTSSSLAVGEYTFCSKQDCAYANGTKYSWSTTQTSSSSTTRLAIGGSNTDAANPWSGTIYRVLYIYNQNPPDDYYLALYRTWTGIVSCKVQYEVFSTRRLVINWDNTGIQVHNGQTWRMYSIPAINPDKRTIKLSTPGTLLRIKEAYEYNGSISNQLAKWHTAKILIKKR